MGSIGRILVTARQLWQLYVGVVIGAIAISATTLLVPFIIARATDTVVGMVQGGPGTIGGGAAVAGRVAAGGKPGQFHTDERHRVLG